MAFSTETIGQLLASGRHYVSTTVGFIGGIGIMSAAQSKGLSDAFQEIFDGLSMIVHGSTSAWGILMVAFPAIGAIIAKTEDSKEAKVAILEAAAPLAVNDIKVADPELAAAVPAPNVKAAI